MYIDIAYQPGTTKTPQVTDLRSPAFIDTDKVYFPENVLRTIPQWSDVTPLGLSFLGGCRSVIGAYTDKYYYFFGTSTRLYVWVNSALYNITPLQASSTAIANSIDTTNTSTTVTINATAHGLVTGDRTKISGATATGGVPAGEINGEPIITYVDANSFTITVETAATSTVSGGGGASTVYYKPIEAGELDQSQGEGYGGGKYGVGEYGVSKTFLNLLKYPRIWSIDIFGNDIVMCPGDYVAGDGQKIFLWDGDVSVAPVVLSNAPTDANWQFVASNAVIALSNNTIQASEVGDATVWTPGTGTSAYTDDIERANRLIRGIRARGTSLLFTEDEVLTFTFIGEPNYWRTDDLQDSDGLIAPKAVTRIGEVVFWMGKRGFYMFDGSGVTKLKNEQNEDWIFENLNSAQRWKCFAKPDPENNQVWFHFPTGSNDEPSDYVVFNVDYGHWTLGKRDLTATQEPAELGDRYFSAHSDSTTVAGAIYRDNQAIGTEALTPSATTNYGMIQGNSRFRINELMVDSFQEGDLTVEVLTKEWPQGSASTSSAYTVTDSTTHVSTKAAGKLRALKFSQSGVAKRFTLGSWKEFIIPQGRR